MVFVSKSIEETENFAASLAGGYPPPYTFLLEGELGAGKTAFARGLARGYGYDKRVSSPTFAIMNVYEGKVKIHHFDFYRINGEEELFDTGFEPPAEDAVTIVEWFKGYEHLFDPGKTTFISITKDDYDDNIRKIKVTNFPERT